MYKVLVVFGTRPEAIKMCPLVAELRKQKDLECVVCVTAQHREMLDQVIRIFDIKVDYDLNIMESSQTLTDITVKVLRGLDEILANESPDLVLVHGDTSTSYAAALSAFYNRIPVGHVEAGLRNQGLKSRDYALIYQTEPRLNLLWSLCSSPSGYTLSLKAGVGWISFMPTLEKLYPEAIYNDKVSFYYNDSNENGNTLGILTTHAPGMERNMKLKPTVNRKIEVGLIGKTPAIRLDMTAFF